MQKKSKQFSAFCIAGTQSGSGKTTVTLAIISALSARGLKVGPFKCGPDYIDTAYHQQASARKCVNLDTWMMGVNAVLNSFATAANDADISVVEGVMGLFDGIDAKSCEGSTAHIAKILQLPVILVVNAHGMGASIAPIVKGFCEFRKYPKIMGVIANNVGSPNHVKLLSEALSCENLAPLLGTLPRNSDFIIPERHLGLLPSCENRKNKDYFNCLAKSAEENIDIDKILKLSKFEKPRLPAKKTLKKRSSILALAKDEAFNFYYPDNLQWLREMGFEIVEFSPLRDKSLPDNTDIVYMGGGFPEIFAKELSENCEIRSSINKFATNGGRIYAECGGMMFLCRALRNSQEEEFPMCSVIPAQTFMRNKMHSFGYREVELIGKNPFFQNHSVLRGHEFHWSDLIPDYPLPPLYKARDIRGKIFDCGISLGNVAASYIHLHFSSLRKIKLGSAKLFAILFLLFAKICSAEIAKDNEISRQHKQLRGIFRINTEISAGEKSLSEIVKKAKEAKVDFLVVSDQFIVRCEYGILPFKNLLRISKEKKSVKKYGIENYLKLIREIDEAEPSVVLIPGVDVAPHYHWQYAPSDGALECRQFSQQLTIFGDIDEKFLRNLPVIHNTSWNTNPISILRKMSPLLLILISLLLLRRKAYYDDKQGNKYYKSNKIQKILASAIFATSILWVLDNKPFTVDHGFDPYSNYENRPFQALITSAKIAKGDKIGISWSSPEAKSETEIKGVKLITEKYHNVITDTFAYDAFAGIYGDSRTAHLPGREWDKALGQYCGGERKNPPFIFGELDYHKDYEGIPFDYIKTVVLLGKDETVSAENIRSAMLLGHSYAVIRSGENEIILDDFHIRNRKGDIAFSGDTLTLLDDNDDITVFIDGHFSQGKTDAARLALIFNGKEILSEKISGQKFQKEISIPKEKLSKTGYLRFSAMSDNAGEILSNPIFFILHTGEN